MATEVILPKVDMDMATGKVNLWHVKDGDTVKKGQVLFEIETDKSAMEIESPADGIVRSLAATGVDIAVGTAVAFVLKAGETLSATASLTLKERQATAAVAVPHSMQPASNANPAYNGSKQGYGVRATPLARRLAKQQGISLAAVTGSGPRGRIVAKDIDTAKAFAAASPIASASVSLASVAANYAEGCSPNAARS